MNLEIITKLDIVLKERITNETQVVYILTRIGKVLELESDVKYPVLKFYRDWSVHTKLDRIKNKEVIDILKEFVREKDTRHHFILHDKFCSELNEFFKNHNIKLLNKANLDMFIFYLGKVISDTPIEVTFDEQKYKISVSEPDKMDRSGLYTISPSP